jgi:hypothetical protein
MIINSKILHLPPYLSTSWNYIASVHMHDTTLIITLIKGNAITIANLPPEIIENIFKAHAEFLDTGRMPEKPPSSQVQAKNLHPFAQALMNAEQNMEVPFRFGFSSLDGLGSALQHNQAQSNAPDLPEEILQKISAIAKIVTPEDQSALPKAEPHCNCMHCQIARAVTSGLQIKTSEPDPEPVVTEEELTFQPWNIQQTGDKIYTVTNRIDMLEKYTVYLGDPVGCTCGKSGCEHILVVLKS